MVPVYLPNNNNTRELFGFMRIKPGIIIIPSMIDNIKRGILTAINPATPPKNKRVNTNNIA